MQSVFHFALEALMEFNVSTVCVIGNWEHVLGGSWNPWLKCSRRSPKILCWNGDSSIMIFFTVTGISGMTYEVKAN